MMSGKQITARAASKQIHTKKNIFEQHDDSMIKHGFPLNLRFYIPVSVLPERKEGDNERLCAM